MSELDEIKKRKLAELQKKQQEALQQQLQEQAQLQQQIEELESAVKQYFTKEALNRYGNLKVAHPEKAVQLLLILGQAIQQGQLNQKIEDYQLKELLKKLTPEKKEFRIRRK